MEGNPIDTFGRWFADGGADVPGGSDGAGGLNPGQQAVFSLLQKQFQNFEGRLSGDDKARVGAHREILFNLEQRLSVPRVACASPTLGDTSGQSRAEQYAADWRSFADMTVAAFGCGLTRVATFEFDLIPPEAYGLSPDAQIHHEYEHNSDPLSYYGGRDGNTAAEAGMIARCKYQSGLVNYLVDRLSKIPEEGGTMLDNTIVVYQADLANGNHGMEFCPFVLFGGGSGAFTPGRYIKYPQSNPNVWGRNWSNERTGEPHSKLHVSLLRAMGLDIDYLHAPEIDGEVPHANEAGKIDMTGPLPRLL